MSNDADARRFDRYCDRLTDDQLQVLHRIVSRRTAAIYRRLWGDHWRAGMVASRARVDASRRA